MLSFIRKNHPKAFSDRLYRSNSLTLEKEYQKMQNKPLKVTVKIGDKEIEGDGQVELYTTLEDLMPELESAESITEILAHLNFSLEAKERNKIRARVIAANSGPDRAIDSSAKQLVKAYAAMGKTISEDDARKKVLAMMNS